MREKLAVKRVHLVCFRLRLHGRTPAAYDVRARDFAYESASYSFRALADRRLSARLSLHSLCSFLARASVALAPFRFYSVLVQPGRMKRTTANDISLRSSLLRHPLHPLFSPFATTSTVPSSSIFPRTLPFRVYLRGKAALSSEMSPMSSDLDAFPNEKFSGILFLDANCDLQMISSSIDCFEFNRQVKTLVSFFFSFFFFFYGVCRRLFAVVCDNIRDIRSRVSVERRSQNRLIKPRAASSGGLF